jgi:hypothetical protein
MGETPDAAIAKTAMLDSQFCLSPMKDDGDCVSAAKVLLNRSNGGIWHY